MSCAPRWRMGVPEESSREFRSRAHSILTMTAPHVHVIQTRSPSTPPSSSPQYWCSWKKARSASKRVRPRWSSTRLLDHVVCLEEKRLRNREAKRLRGLEVDD